MKAVIFDMDGLLIDSEPYWQQAGAIGLSRFGIELSPEQQFTAIGLRTEEWVAHWFHYFKLPLKEAQETVQLIMNTALQLIDEHAKLFPGALEAVNTVRDLGLKVAIATSSPLDFVAVLRRKMKLNYEFDAISSAQELPFGKPHPEVYINCARLLNISPLDCLAVEDSFNGLIAAKAARMKCFVLPHPADFEHLKWGAADGKMENLSLLNKFLVDKFKQPVLIS